MPEVPFNFIHRRSSISGFSPDLNTLCNGEIYIQQADETIYFKNNIGQKVTVLTSHHSGSYITTGQTGAFGGGGADLSNYVQKSSTGNFVTSNQTGNFVYAIGGTIPSSFLPSYVDEILEYASTGSFPTTGEIGHIYLISGCSSFWRWASNSNSYFEIKSSPGSTDAVPEGSLNLYYTPARAASAAPVQSVAGLSGTISQSSLESALTNLVCKSQTGSFTGSFAPASNTICTLTSNYTLSSSNNNIIFRYSGSAESNSGVLTLPSGNQFPVGGSVLAVQVASGKLLFTGQAGVTLLKNPSTASGTCTKGSVVSFMYTSQNEWFVAGDII